MSRSRLAVVTALFAVYIFWGATAPAIKVAVEDVPPFIMAATRFFFGGTILWCWSRARGVPLPARRDWIGALYSSALLLVLSNAVFGWTLQSIPSGIGSLFFALSPIWNAVIATTFYRERISPQGVAGIVLGLGGLAVLLAPAGADRLALGPALVAAATSLTWSIGSMIQRRYAATDYLQMSAMQMLVACAMLIVLAPLTGERFAIVEYTPHAIGAIAFLVVFGSIVAYSSYVWLMRTQSTSLASTNSYVNPVVSMIIATSLLGEKLVPRDVIAAAIVLAGVALMLAQPRGRVARAAAAAD